MKHQIFAAILLIFLITFSATAQEPTPDPSTIQSDHEIIVATDHQGIEMVFVPGGTFELGASPETLASICIANGVDAACYSGEGIEFIPDVQVQDFWIDRYEVTVEQYQRCI